jgi:uncharacterized membrane protein SpoIIM required for sporulation
VFFEIFAQVKPSPMLSIAAAAAFAIFTAHYCVGLQLNLQHHRVQSGARRIAIYVAQVALLPVFALLEASAVLYAGVNPAFDFHVVKK